MTLLPDLFSFAYVPNWYIQLDELAALALPEPWRFRNPAYLTKNPDNPILERYIHAIFKKQVIDYNTEKQREKAPDYLHVENEFVCFHTGLYTRRYKAIYGCFDRNKKKDSLLNWYFRGFSDELAPCLKYVNPLPKKPRYDMAQYGVNYNPEWPIRVNTDHILGDPENFSRLPETARSAKNLPLLLETAVELARRWAVVDPSIVAPQGYQGRVQYLLPICLTDMENPDLAMTLTVMDGYYLGNTCLTLEMAYHQLHAHGVDCVILAPTTMMTTPDKRIKTDRRDARLISKCLAFHTYSPVYIPTEMDDAVKEYIRMRDDANSALVRVKQQIIAFCIRHGKVHDGKSYWTNKHLDWLSNLDFGNGILSEVLQEYLIRYYQLREQVDMYDMRINELAQAEPYREKVEKLGCFRGIAAHTALSFCVEVGDFRRFATAQQFASYLGLVPGECSSGDKQQYTGITKAGIHIFANCL